MKHCIAFLIALGLLLAAPPVGVAADSESSPAGSSSAASTSGTPSGAKVIFNGKDLEGWVVEGNGKFKEKVKGDDGKMTEVEKPVWTVTEEGNILCAGKGYGFLRYDTPYCDFVLHLEYRLNKKCNSGIGIRHAKFTNGNSRPSASGFEIQILDEPGKKPNDHSCFSLYRHLAAKADPSKPAGEWNVFEVRCVGTKIQLTVNGEQIHDVDQSKHSNIKNQPLCGYFSLQNHGGRIEFRNISVTDLNPGVSTVEQLAGQPVKVEPAKTETKAENKKDNAEKDDAKKNESKKDNATKDEAKKEPAKSTEAKAVSSDKRLALKLRTRTAADDEKDKWNVGSTSKEIPAAQTALVICDLWDNHWCKNAATRCDAIAKRVAPMVEELRAAGVHIVHCPSDTMAFYKDSPARQRILDAPAATPPSPIARWVYLNPKVEAPLPIDDSDGGSDDETPVKSFKAWSRQHAAVKVDPDRDVVSENGSEVYNYFAKHNIKHVLYCGVHTNMCVLGRSFGIRQMKTLGFDVALIRDLTDTMYNPKMRPFVSHDAGTELVLEHVEKYWAPTLLRSDMQVK